MQYDSGIVPYAEGAVWTGCISITSNSRVEVVLTPSRTWSCFVSGVMVMHTGSSVTSDSRFFPGNYGWCLVESLPPLPLSEESMVVNAAVAASFGRKSELYASSGSMR